MGANYDLFATIIYHPLRVRYKMKLSMERFKGMIWFQFLIISCCSLYAQEFQTGFIAEDTEWQTEYYIIDSRKSGPTVMITGGIHGNEPAGAREADHVRHYPLKRGKLIVVPKVNKPGLEKGTRNMPSVPEELANLNRNFPKNNTEKGLCKLSNELWKLVCQEHPDWLIDLHEGFDFTKVNSKSVGSSIITSSLPQARKQAQSMMEALNATIEMEEKRFILKGPPAKGSLARATADQLSIKSMLLETTFKDQHLSLRIRQHRIMLHRLLSDLQMIDCDVDMMINPSDSQEAVGDKDK